MRDELAADTLVQRIADCDGAIKSDDSGPPGSVSISLSNVNVIMRDATNTVVAAGNAVTIAADPDQSMVFFRTQHSVPKLHFKPFERSARDILGFRRIEHGHFYSDDGVMGNICVVWAVVRRDAPYVLARSMGLSGYQSVQILPAWYDMLEETTRIRNQMCNPQDDEQDSSDEEQYHLGVDEDEDCTGKEATIAEDDDMRPEEDVRAAGRGHGATNAKAPAAMEEIDMEHYHSDSDGNASDASSQCTVRSESYEVIDVQYAAPPSALLSQARQSVPPAQQAPPPSRSSPTMAPPAPAPALDAQQAPRSSRSSPTMAPPAPAPAASAAQAPPPAQTSPPASQAPQRAGHSSSLVNSIRQLVLRHASAVARPQALRRP